jgi:uncharacterized membrane protein
MLPIGITILIFKFFFDLLDPLPHLVLRWIPKLDTCWSLTAPGTICPGFGLVLLLVLVYLVGLITTHVVGRRVVAIFHGILEAIPVVKSIYRTTRSAVELLSTSGNHEHPYSGVVLVDFPSRGFKSLGLITAHLGVRDGEETLAVFVPNSPVPSTGFLVVVSAKDVITTQMSVDDALKILVSGGILAKDLYMPSISSLKEESTSGDYVATDKTS